MDAEAESEMWREDAEFARAREDDEVAAAVARGAPGEGPKL